MIQFLYSPELPRWQRWLLIILHLFVIAGALALVLMISADTFRNVSFLGDPQYLRWQFWICLLFLVDITVGFCLAPNKWHFLRNNLFFLLICVPYVNILNWFHVQVPGEMVFLLRVIPMVRAAYVLAVVTGTLGHDRIRNMFKCYIMLLAGIVYFSSLMFYVEEHAVNPDIRSYWSSLWWSLMTMTTAGCYINEYTTVGRVLSVVLSGGGLILFPVFTVYIAHAVSGDDADN